MRSALVLLALGLTLGTQAQDVSVIKNNAATPVKNQDLTGTCWCFSATSMLESDCLRNGQPPLDLSEMYTVRNIYIEKAQNYIHRQGFARFDEGGLGHDVIHSVTTYGIEPESVYSGLVNGQKQHNHSEMVATLKAYLDSILKVSRPIPDNWQVGFEAILDKYMGAPPKTFTFEGHSYTPQSYAKEVVKFNPDDYAYFTSFTHHPFYKSFIVEVPDNFSNGSYYNVPVNELIAVAKTAVEKGYTVLWDADVSNAGWLPGAGYALFPEKDSLVRGGHINPDMKEAAYSQELRQKLYDELVTEDDHLMHITGLGKSKQGKDFFIVKNSWGTKIGPFEGYVDVSFSYFAMNTITLIVPKAALEKGTGTTKVAMK
jgi:bleomycin hydrolase